MMGRVLRQEVIAIACNRRTCTNQVAVGPYPLSADSIDMLPTLARLVAAGWGLILNDTLRSYCPDHEPQVWACSCRTRKDQQMHCPEHSDEARANVWTSTDTPEFLAEEFARLGLTPTVNGMKS